LLAPAAWYILPLHPLENSKEAQQRKFVKTQHAVH